MKRRRFEQLVRQCLEEIPEQFRNAMQNLEIVVEDWPDPELMEEEFGDPDIVLYGLFTGTPLTERHFDDPAQLPAVIQIYQGPLEEDFPDPDDLRHEIRTTLVHEIGHFLGFDEATLTDYGYD